jgi:hypothetical protein
MARDQGFELGQVAVGFGVELGQVKARRFDGHQFLLRVGWSTLPPT